MLLGRRLNGAYAGWREVEGDLYSVSARVQEYDRDARLVREDATGCLGLARYVPDYMVVGNARLRLARILRDPVTDELLTGEPDPRVLKQQRALDIWRWHNRHDFYRRVEAAEARQEARKEASTLESFGDHSERFVHSLKRDVTAKPRAFFSDRERVAA